MLPRRSCADHVDVGPAYPEPSGQRHASFVAGSDSQHINFPELVGSAGFTLGHQSPLHSISGIFGSRSPSQVARIDANGIVAGMKRKGPLKGARPSIQNERDMGSLTPSLVDLYNGVAGAAYRAYPRPALVITVAAKPAVKFSDEVRSANFRKPFHGPWVHRKLSGCKPSTCPKKGA